MKIVGLVILILFLSACATPGTSSFNYSVPNSGGQIQNSIVVDEDFEAVWDRLVGRLATGFFVINNIDKSSRLINVSFSSDNPEEYIDCGISTRSYKYKDESQTYRYKVAQDSTYKRAGSWGQMDTLPWTQEVYRDASLDGRINIYVAPMSGKGTQVSVNAKYLFELNASGTTYSYTYGDLRGRETFSAPSSSIDFTTNESKTKKWGSGATFENVTCMAIGNLEMTLLEMAKQ